MNLPPRFLNHAVAASGALALFLSPVLTACGPPQTSTTVIIAASATANEPAPALSANITNMLRSAVAGNASAAALVVNPVSGQPASLPLTPRRQDGQVDYGPQRGQELAANLDAVQRTLGREAATGPFDLLDTLEAATRVASAPTTLIVLSSGLSTAGALDMRQLGWDFNPASVAAQLKARGQLPDLTGFRVVFSGLGISSGRQPALPLPQQRTLTALWLAICRDSGAASCRADNLTRPDPPSLSRTPVPVVTVPAVTSVRSPAGGTSVSVPASLLFSFDSSVLLPGANSILEPIVRQAVDSNQQVTVIGYASPDGGTAAYNQALSARRAQAVSRQLTALGLLARQVAGVAGAGTGGKTISACLDHGRLDEAACGRLRRVVITLSPARASA